ncbi:DUF4145 domain-containing protein [Aeromonas sp. HMWF016]|uniref:DUF4145 domain-containing protein n=1 Tax=Aeromonas sp. HMWF016 TaxID=2056852 RepID=UPI000D34FA26|nr:DUF4145 domain-containing protein [Aeromonas sp. HMWF016]PTT44894.1 hypothetical protein DBR09_17400 [Aeromonas sp. HMWF016]
MKSQYYPPVYHGKNYHCPRCQVYSSQSWTTLMLDLGNYYQQSEFEASSCAHCGLQSFWYQERLIDPNSSLAEPMHHDLPEDCQAEYEEARDIVGRSPRGAAALLRLCLQKLMVHFGAVGKNINDDIKFIVAKGVSTEVQRALDICRVAGNNAAHPGELNIEDTPEIAHMMFKMINFLVAELITRPNEINAMFDQLPQGARDAIEKRDAAK